MNIYLLADGLSEDPKVTTSLEISSHPNLDKLFTGGTPFLFEPVRANNMLHPATYFIFPYFFGLNPETNPGRAAFELIENGYDIIPYNSFAIFRIIHKSYNVRRGWYEKEMPLSLDLVEPIIKSVSMEKYQNCTRSVIAKSKLSHNIWCVGSETEDSLEYIINTLQYEFSQYDLNVYPTLIHNRIHHESPTCSIKKDGHILGWMLGPTAEAFRFLGFSVDGQKCSEPAYVYNFKAKMEDFQSRILPRIKHMALDDNNYDLVIYIKETSSAAKKNMPAKKIMAIEFLDAIVADILREKYPTRVNVILISDHQSNIGIPYVFPGPSLACVYNNESRDEINRPCKLTEKNILKRIPRVLSQEECIKSINNIISR